jgi:type I restriction enzyme S subunit
MVEDTMLFDLNIDKSNWLPVKFGDVVREIRESSGNPEADGLHRIIGLEHIDPENIHLIRWGELADSITFSRIFRKGQVLFGKRRSYLKKAALAGFDGICSGDIIVMEAKEDLLPELLPFLVCNDKFFDHAVKTSAGSLSPRTKFKDLAEFEVLLPPIEQQAELAELLWAGDEMVESSKILNVQLETAKNAFFKNSFRSSEGDEIRFSDLLNINPTIPKSGIDPNINVSFVTMADVTEDGYISTKETRKLAEVKKAFTYFAENDILFAKITPCMENGKGAIATDLTSLIGYGSTEFHVLRPLLDSDLYFCFFLTQMPFFRKKAEQHMTGSAGQKRVPSDFFSTFRFIAPEAEKRHEIGKVTLEMEKNLQQVKSQIKFSQQLQKSIINQIF